MNLLKLLELSEQELVELGVPYFQMRINGKVRCVPKVLVEAEQHAPTSVKKMKMYVSRHDGMGYCVHWSVFLRDERVRKAQIEKHLRETSLI
jgi:hypothetical protein